MKWLRVWLKEEEHEGGKTITGIVIGAPDETWLMVRLDNGKVETFNHSYVVQSKWVNSPDKKVSMPRVVK